MTELLLKLNLKKSFDIVQFSQTSDLCVAWKLFLRLTLSVNEYYL